MRRSLDSASEYSSARQQYRHWVIFLDSAIDFKHITKERDFLSLAFLIVPVSEEQDDQNNLNQSNCTLAIMRIMTKANWKRRKGVWMVEWVVGGVGFHRG